MQNLKNIAVGFLVSFIGSIPLGYLNLVGFIIYGKDGLNATCLYLLGVVCIEFLVIYFTLVFAKRLVSNQGLIKFIEAFSIVFMLLLAYLFYSSGDSENINHTVFRNVYGNTFLSGIVLSCLNFIQIPFWLSWNLYLLNGKYIETSGKRKYFYVSGTVAGTFFGMLALILSLHYFATNVAFMSKYLMQVIIPLVFLGLGIFQGIKFFKKYYR